jgi:hypothetical protein
MTPIPHEISIAGVYLPPVLIAAVLGVAIALVTTRLLDRHGLSRHFFYPPIVSLSLMLIYTVLISTFVIGG